MVSYCKELFCSNLLGDEGFLPVGKGSQREAVKATAEQLEWKTFSHVHEISVMNSMKNSEVTAAGSRLFYPLYHLRVGRSFFQKHLLGRWVSILCLAQC